MGVDLHAPEIYVIYVYALFVADASDRVAFIRRNVERLFADVVQQMQQHPWLMWEDRQVPQSKPQGVPVGVEHPYVQEANALTQLGLLSQGGSHSSAAGEVPSTPQPSSQVPGTQTTSVSPAPFPSQVVEVPDSNQVPFSGVLDSFSVATDVNQMLQPQNTQVSPVSANSSGNGSVMAFFPM